MDRTAIIVVSICIVLFGFWFVEQQKYAEQLARQQQLQRLQLSTNAAAPAQTQTTNPIATSATATSNSAQIFATNTPEQLLVLTNRQPDYTNRYTFTSRGGGIKSIELLKYPETISPRWKKEMATNAVATLNTRAPVPVLAILGDASFVGDGNFTLTKTSDGVRAEKTFTNGLVLTKEFHVSSNYLVNASVSWKNNSGKPLALPAQEWVVGAATPMGPDDNGMYEGAMWFDGKEPLDHPVSYFSTNTTTLGFFHRTPTTEYVAGAGDVVWAAAHNQFFALVAMPQKPAQQIIARPIDLPPLINGEQLPNAPRGVQIALGYPAMTLTTNQPVEKQIVFYAGPKEYRTLARIGEQFQNHADLVMNFGTGIASFFGIGTFFAKALLLAMNWIHDVTHLGYGWAIVLITILLRGIFWPLTSASMRSMKKMQALAPQLKAIQEKYKDDVKKLFSKRQELLKKNNVSQMSGCLPLLIQTPVFIGFYTMLRSAIELRGAHFLWVADLSKPDTLFMIPGITFIPFNISTPEGLPVNLLPLLMVAVMIWQAHLTPPSPGMDPGQQKMMRFMPLLMLIFFYNYASGMALYMTISTLSSVLQNKLTRMNLAAETIVTTTNPALTPPQKKKK